MVGNLELEQKISLENYKTNKNILKSYDKYKILGDIELDNLSFILSYIKQENLELSDITIFEFGAKHCYFNATETINCSAISHFFALSNLPIEYHPIDYSFSEKKFKNEINILKYCKEESEKINEPLSPVNEQYKNVNLENLYKKINIISLNNYEEIKFQYYKTIGNNKTPIIFSNMVLDSNEKTYLIDFMDIKGLHIHNCLTVEMCHNKKFSKLNANQFLLPGVNTDENLLTSYKYKFEIDSEFQKKHIDNFKKYYGLTMNNVKFHFPEEMKDITYIWNSPLDKQA
jgi:hypothetical protein